jgi:hypothetical protein
MDCQLLEELKILLSIVEEVEYMAALAVAAGFGYPVLQITLINARFMLQSRHDVLSRVKLQCCVM